MREELVKQNRLHFHFRHLIWISSLELLYFKRLISSFIIDLFLKCRIINRFTEKYNHLTKISPMFSHELVHMSIYHR